jgi:hypothetical protein
MVLCELWVTFVNFVVKIQWNEDINHKVHKEKATQCTQRKTVIE